jgi:hypothetical protein
MDEVWKKSGIEYSTFGGLSVSIENRVSRIKHQTHINFLDASSCFVFNMLVFINEIQILTGFTGLSCFSCLIPF